MRSNRGKNRMTACPCLFLRDCLSFLGVGYGRFRNIDTKCITQRFYSFRLVLCFCLGLWAWFSPLPLLAEFESNDKTNLQNVAFDVNGILLKNSSIYDLLRSALSNSGGSGYIGATLNEMGSDVNTLTLQNSQLFNVLGYGYASSQSGSLKQSLNTIINYLGYGSGNSVSSHLTSIMNQTNQIKTALGGDQYNTIADRLDDIITALNSTSTPTLPSDIASETTVRSFSNNFQSYYDFIKDGFIYGNGSTYSYADYNLRQLLWYLNYGTYAGPNRNYIYRIFRGMDKGDTSPFPDSLHKFPKVEGLLQEVGGSFITPFERLSYTLNDQSRYSMENDILLAKKQAWNDWYAHTNMVAQIVAQVDRVVLPPEDGRQDSTFDPNTGEITTPFSGGTGSSGDEVIGFKPVYTNDFAVIEQDSTTVTNSFDFVKQEEIKSRYINDEMLDVGTYQEYGSAGGQFTGVIQLDAFRIDLSQHYDQYRLLVSIRNLETFRTAMSWVWKLLACISGFWFVLKIANLSSSEGAE